MYKLINQVMVFIMLISILGSVIAGETEGMADESSTTLIKNREVQIRSNIQNALDNFHVLRRSLDQTMIAGDVTYNPGDSEDIGCLEFPKSFEEKFINELISWVPIPSKVLEEEIQWYSKTLLKKTAKHLLVSYYKLDSTKYILPEVDAQVEYNNLRNAAKTLIENIKVVINGLHVELELVINNIIPKLDIPSSSKLSKQASLKQLWQVGVNKYNWPVSTAFVSYSDR